MGEVEFDLWYEREGIAVLFRKVTETRGTYAFIRGEVDKLADLIPRLEQEYYPGRTILFNPRNEVLPILRRVLKTGQSERDLMVSSDDRIRRIRRLDEIKEGPYANSVEHLELTHHEQYGGNSRREMIEKVAAALNL